MFDGLDETDQLLLICGEFSMLWHNGHSKEHNRAVALV
jgi:hypothetical protein